MPQPTESTDPPVPASAAAPTAAPVVHIVGARPNFIKCAPVMRAMAAAGIPQRLVHTGQHYDVRMSDVFVRDLDLPQPDSSLGVGSGSHAGQTAALLTALEGALVSADPAARPALVMVYGDVNSTLAAALVCSKTGIPMAHVEAGLRSFDMTMPEEVNRRVTDILSDLLFVTSPEALDNLAREGVDLERCHFVGNPMIDTLLAHLARFDPDPMRERLGLAGPYAVATLHRPANVDTVQAAGRLVAALHELSARLPIVLPLHPRGRATLTAAGLLDVPELQVVEPLGYVEFLSLVRGSSVVVTDSGGIQEETTILGIPCLTLRPNTERPITISHGTNRLVEPDRLGAAVDAALRGELARPGDGPPLWDGRAGERIAALVADWLAARA
ncbi:MAG: UDP-N-acetylglucosamine 2-epimerase (non-hydrolyzing) [Thermoleophilia bacterium]|nr:UDP-N-acetylglucosamine 2-epimerase (non-hydrolyzing) [Thermoleophilia bacterium]